jgi:hypothetical protein
MLAGLLSVLLVAGLIGLGVWVATDEPAAAPEPEPATFAAAPPPEETPIATAGAVDKLPAVKIKDLTAAATAAGCSLSAPPDEGHAHDAREFTINDYRSNPPTSGTHFPEWYEDGIYAGGTTPELGKLVHALEHGRIELQYEPGTSPEDIAQLEILVNELDRGHHVLLVENDTEMPFAVAAAAWGHLLGCPKMNDKVFDALRAFRANYVDKGPETVP